MIPSWRQLVQVVQSWVKLILLGLFCPLVRQEFTEVYEYAYLYNWISICMFFKYEFKKILKLENSIAKDKV